MATAKKAAPAAKKTGGALVKWDEALAAKAKAAQRVAAAVSGGGGNFLSFKGGRLSYQDHQVKDGMLDVIVISAVAENNWYDGPYNPKVPQSPACYAFGRPDGDDDDMAPHKAVFEAGNNQSDKCKGCEHNEWGSAEKGRGKACKNVVRLAMLVADVMDAADPAEAISKAEVVYAKLPVTSGKNWAGYVNSLGSKHYLQYVTTLKVVPDEDGEYYFIEFEAAQEITGEAIGALLARSDKEDSAIGFAYPKFDDQQPAKGAKRGGPARKVIPVKAAAKPAAKPRAAKY